MLAIFPLTTARDRRWWNRHCCSLGSPEADISTLKFLCEAAQKVAVDLPYTPVSGFNCDWLKALIV